MDAYVYQAALLCRPCAGEIANAIGFQNVLADRDIMRPWRSWEDSDSYPQGPYGDGGGEADIPQHCDACGVFLENPLTRDGTRYVNEKLTEHARDGSGDKAVLETWGKHYNASVYDPSSTTLEDLQFEYSMEDDDWGGCRSW
jgi:hypothetical protein